MQAMPLPVFNHNNHNHTLAIRLAIASVWSLDANKSRLTIVKCT